MEKDTLKAYVITDLTAELAVENMDSEYGEDDYAELDGRDLTDYESSVREYIEKEKELLDDGGNLAPYIDESLLRLRENVLRIEPDVVVYEGKLCGCAIVELKQELSERDWNLLLSYISGQYSDGWGEGFEQRDIPVADSILNVHFWQPDQKYPIVLDTLPGQAPTAPQQVQKPRMKLLGQDGNIFSILGRAGRLLRQNGQSKQAEEMFRRVQDSGDYYKALGIISEYVQTELSVETEKGKMLQPKKDKQERGQER